ncbi:MAG TPA: glycosyltransferase [Patescibacteria group bacterium]|nr:glycosyltransferase [Patescibacteria group bacterium]
MTISAHTLVKNEEKFIWYSVGSVIDHVDKVLLWDTGSTDATWKILEEIKKRYPDKVDLKEMGPVDPERFANLRQKMLEATDSDWVFILDGDEVWWEDSIKKVKSEIKENKFDAVVVPFVNAVGDIFHRQSERAGKYKIDGRKGNITLRLFRSDIPGLNVVKRYFQEGYADETGSLLQESGKVIRKYIDAPFFHLTHIPRSSKDQGTMGRRGKIKHEFGISHPLDYYYPEVFFRTRPGIVESVWEKVSRGFKARAFFENPARKIKRSVGL